MMDGCNERPFVAGTIVGVRSFNTDSLGRLRAVTRSNVFKPGDNEAGCHLSYLDRMNSDRAQMRRLTVSGLSEPQPRQKSKGDTHVVAGKDCTCGYYAYTDGTPHHEGAKDKPVVAVVEGWGTVTVGSRGFRAQNLKLRALVAPSDLKRKAWLTFFTFLVALWCWIPVSDLFFLVASDWSPWRLLYLPFIIAAPWLVRFNLKQRRKFSGGWFKTVRGNYPDVPVYRSLRAALKDHPTTEPPPVTPDTAEDFWTRSAS